MSDQQKVAEATIVERFLAEPAIKAAIERLHKQYYTEFRGASTPEALAQAHAKSRVLDDFAGELVGVKNAGQVAKVRLDQVERAEARKAQPTRQRS